MSEIQTTVNAQVTDAVTQTNVKVLGEAPAQAMASLYQTLAQSLSLAMTNAIAIQHGGQLIGQAVVTTAVRMILAENPTPPSNPKS